MCGRLLWPGFLQLHCPKLLTISRHRALAIACVSQLDTASRSRATASDARRRRYLDPSHSGNRVVRPPNMQQEQLSTGKGHKLKSVHDTDRHASTLERLIAKEATLMWLWSRMASLLVENKHRCGLGHWSDDKVADNAQRVFDALL